MQARQLFGKTSRLTFCLAFVLILSGVLLANSLQIETDLGGRITGGDTLLSEWALAGFTLLLAFATFALVWVTYRLVKVTEHHVEHTRRYVEVMANILRNEELSVITFSLLKSSAPGDSGLCIEAISAGRMACQILTLHINVTGQPEVEVKEARDVWLVPMRRQEYQADVLKTIWADGREKEVKIFSEYSNLAGHRHQAASLWSLDPVNRTVQPKQFRA